MNCPQCQQPIGADQFKLGEWIDDIVAHGVPTGCHRIVSIECDFCGLFEVKQDQDEHIIKLRGPIVADKAARKVERRIPSARFTRRIPA